LWPSELEAVLDLSAARLNVVRENLEVALRYLYTILLAKINSFNVISQALFKE